jgi:hypothetical protein
MVSIVGASGRTPMMGERQLAPTFCNDEVAAQSCSEQDRWTFYENIKIRQRQVVPPNPSSK